MPYKQGWETLVNNILKLDVKNQSVNELAETITHELACMVVT